MTTQLSEHFSLEELVRSQYALRTGVDNTPGSATLADLERLCAQLLEPARAILGPLHVDSGYRSPVVNRAVGGAENSAHLFGRAADVIPIGMSVRDAFTLLRTHGDLPFDQMIGECGFAWLHLAIAPDGAEPRRQVLTAAGGPGHWTYAEVA